jgi:hypothetical protein
MPPPYALNGHLKLWAFTITLSEGSTMKNIYLFKVPHDLIPDPEEHDLDSRVKSLIKEARDEWLPFVKFDLEVGVSGEEYREDFDLPENEFGKFTTKAGIEVYRVTHHKV